MKPHRVSNVIAARLQIGANSPLDLPTDDPTSIESHPMPYVLVRHKVADFSKWKPVYDAHLPAREEAGMIKEVHLLRNADDPNEVFIMSEVENLQKARDFAASSDLREKMQEAGVVDRPDIYFLE
jgi:hypothetical protein